MPEPFKNMFNKKIICAMAKHLSTAWPAFNSSAFIKTASKNLDDLELKERSTQITQALTTYLPANFKQAANILLASLAPDDTNGNNTNQNDPGISGWPILPMADYVGLNGINHFELSMTVFKKMTRHFSSEFGIRFFLLAEPERTLSILKTWVNDADYHVRRLVSEGTRPRLPWAMQLPLFIKNPAPVISLLKLLRDDEQEYVRRSVANNLNDIAKDHPAIVASIAREWLKDADKNRNKLIRHACRTLIKQGHQPTLKALGYSAPKIKLKKFIILTPQVKFGDALLFEISLDSESRRKQELIIDYAIHHRKANGTTTPKVFKCKIATLKPAETLTLKRKHAIKQITTRTYYPGTHRLEILINGKSISTKEFQLKM